MSRIRALAIPPAWREVWICPNPLGHLQATGRDARGRKQHRYHADWRRVRDSAKYNQLLEFAGALPHLRRRTTADLSGVKLTRQKVLATVVQLLEKTLIRVGNAEYARDNDSFGLTTMRDGQARVTGSTIRFRFNGKSGKFHDIQLHDTRLARVIRRCQELPGRELFQFIDDEGVVQDIGSADVNEYLRGVTGQDFTAKHFRTWTGTVLACAALHAVGPFQSPTEGKRHVLRVLDTVAGLLGNTRSVCRKCYIHPAVIDAYMEGELPPIPNGSVSGLAPKSGRAAALLVEPARFRAVESVVLAILRRTNRKTKRKAA